MRTRIQGAFRAMLVACLVSAVWFGAAHAARAQTPFVPYFGKNLVHYGNFDWQVYNTDHFQIYYYPDVERHLERVAGLFEMKPAGV